MRKLQAIIKDIKQSKQYFREAKAEISDKNISVLRTFSVSCVILLLLFMILARYIIQEWTPTIQHILFLPVSIAFCAAAMYLYKYNGRKNTKKDNSIVITCVCLLFELMVYIFVILIDVFASAESPASFMPLLFVIFPALFIIPFEISYSLVLALEIVYVILVSSVKNPTLAQYDIFNSVVGIMCSLAVSKLIINLRIKDHVSRMKYKRLSMHDPLLGVLNKTTSSNMIKEYIDRKNPITECMMLFIDLDNFKVVNDTVGHRMGDVLLKNVALVLLDVFDGESDIVGRFGGDEFMIFVAGESDVDVLEEKCLNIQKRLLKIIMEREIPFVTCSMGGVAVKRKDVDFDMIFEVADNALYEAKNNGKNKYVLQELK